MKHRETKRKEDFDWTRGASEVLKGGALAGTVTVAFLLFCAVLIAGGVIGERWMDPVVLVSCVSGSAVGALWAGKRLAVSRWLVGICVGGELFLILFGAGAAIYGRTALGQGSAKLLAACLCGGALGAYLRKNKGKKNGRRERRNGRM